MTHYKQSYDSTDLIFKHTIIIIKKKLKTSSLFATAVLCNVLLTGRGAFLNNTRNMRAELLLHKAPSERIVFRETNFPQRKMLLCSD